MKTIQNSHRKTHDKGKGRRSNKSPLPHLNRAFITTQWQQCHTVVTVSDGSQRRAHPLEARNGWPHKLAAEHYGLLVHTHGSTKKSELPNWPSMPTNWGQLGGFFFFAKLGVSKSVGWYTPHLAFFTFSVGYSSLVSLVCLLLRQAASWWPRIVECDIASLTWLCPLYVLLVHCSVISEPNPSTHLCSQCSNYISDE